jgi:hypothetical protein
MSVLLEVIDPRGKKVILTEDQWVNHILDEHPYMKALLQEIKSAIETPYVGFIYEDSSLENRHIYYHRKITDDLYVKVVVGFGSNESGEVITAFKTDSGKKGEDVIWPRLNV